MRAEAYLLLAAARLSVAVLPFAWLRRLLVEQAAGAPPGAAESLIVRQVSGAVLRAATRPRPWCRCLPQALAGHWMLARRGIGSAIGFGVRRDAAGLSSHAWLICRDGIVLGGENAAEFTFVARYPQ